MVRNPKFLSTFFNKSLDPPYKIHHARLMNLKTYNSKQKEELSRIKNEVKWLVGERLGYDPSSTREGQIQVETYFAEVLISGAGRYLSELVQKNEKLETLDN